ncbi:integrase/recombinase [mine drainage metagenome]|uniref:Integrase/recombinase n=1 Tax=mine drainage metagenome TaxID=410659 RepID=T0ZFR0_9ZZZZ
MTFEAKYKDMLKDREISRWFDNLRAKSYLTATVCLRGLGYYCELTGSTHNSILEDARSGKEIMDYRSLKHSVKRMPQESMHIAVVSSMVVI